MGEIEIYIADDDDDDRMFIKEAINKILPLAKVMEALNGQDLIQQVQNCTMESQIILILVDMNMPKINGLEAASQIKSDPKYQKLPVIMISTSQDGELKQKAYDMGIDSFITKPVTYDGYEAIVLHLKNHYVDEFLFEITRT